MNVQDLPFIHKALLVYFSEKGESMSDAQNLKGKCTQIAEDVRGHFEGLGPVKEVVLFDGKPVDLLVPNVKSAAEISDLVGKDAEANALNGWYARAIEAKTVIMDNIRAATWSAFLKDGEEIVSNQYDETFDLPRPVLKTVTEDDILGSWSANDLADFLMKEQYCATVGKLIHKKGKLHSLYLTPQSSTSRFQDLNSGERGGLKAYPVTITPLYKGKELQAIKEVYLAKHDEHRTIEKKVNWYKAKIKNQLNDQNAEFQKQYADELSVWNKEQKAFNERRQTFLQDVSNKNHTLSATCESRRLNMLKAASEMKIFIPENLRPIKKFVQEYKVL